MIWLLRAIFVVALAITATLAARATSAPAAAPESVPSAPSVAPPPTLPRPTSTPEPVTSRMARVPPTIVPRPTLDPAGPGRVSVVDSAFDPPELTIRVGQSVAWLHEGGLVHDVTAQGGEAWSSGVLTSGATYQRVFASVGQFDFYCTIHPTMRGRVTVLP